MVLSAAYAVFELRSGQTHDNTIVIGDFSAKQVAIMSKTKNWLARS